MFVMPLIVVYVIYIFPSCQRLQAFAFRRSKVFYTYFSRWLLSTRGHLSDRMSQLLRQAEEHEFKKRKQRDLDKLREQEDDEYYRRKALVRWQRGDVALLIFLQEIDLDKKDVQKDTSNESIHLSSIYQKTVDTSCARSPRQRLRNRI